MLHILSEEKIESPDSTVTLMGQSCSVGTFLFGPLFVWTLVFPWSKFFLVHPLFSADESYGDVMVACHQHILLFEGL